MDAAALPDSFESASKGALVYIALHGRYFVLVELIHAVVAQLGDHLHILLDDHRTYTARQLCGEEFWALLCRREKLLVGSCISHLANEGALPFVRINEFKKYPNRYQLKTQVSADEGVRKSGCRAA